MKHILGPADGVPSQYQCCEQVDGIEALENQQAHCLPRKDEPAFHPERGGNQEISQIAEVQEVLRAVFVPIDRCPYEQPQGPGNFQPQRDARLCRAIRRPVTYYVSNLPVQSGVPTMRL